MVCYNNVYDLYFDERCLGDGSASTLWDNHKWNKYFDVDACEQQGPPYIIADVIRTILPNSKILVMLRNPTERLVCIRGVRKKGTCTQIESYSAFLYGNILEHKDTELNFISKEKLN